MVGHCAARYIEATVPASAGTWDADDVVYLRRVNDNIGAVLEIVLYIQSLPTSGEIHVDILREGAPAAGRDIDLDSNWLLSVATYNTTGLKDPVVLYSPGVRVRAVSQGSSGTAVFTTNYLY